LIVLDTNVVSALMLKAPDARVVAWLDAQPASSVWITSVTLFELQYGLAILPQGKKRATLEKSLELVLREDLESRVLPFDESAASAAAVIAATLRKGGHGADVRDTMIAGMVCARKALLATRNTRHFEHSGVRLVDPWNPVTH
jgi:predicted nucleic acid-binding protein